MIEKKFLIQKRDGAKLHAVQYLIHKDSNMDKTKQKPPLVILCHGFTGGKYEQGRFPETAKAINQNDMDALIFDFTGSGENKREPVRLGQQRNDLEDVVQWAVNEQYYQIGVIGLSFGGLTTLVANIPEVKTFVFWAPAFQIRRNFGLSDRILVRVKERLRKKPMTFASGDSEAIIINDGFVEDLINLNPDAFLKKLKIPSLIIQGTADLTVKPTDTRNAFDLIPDDVIRDYIEVDGAGHDFQGEDFRKFLNHSINWLTRFLE